MNSLHYFSCTKFSWNAKLNINRDVYRDLADDGVKDFIMNTRVNYYRKQRNILAATFIKWNRQIYLHSRTNKIWKNKLAALDGSHITTMQVARLPSYF